MELRAAGLRLAYGDRVVVPDLTLPVPAGRISVIVGPNACGKSTLLRALARLLTPRAGAVLLDGRSLHASPTRDVARRLGILPQAPVAPDGLTVIDLVTRGRAPHQSWWRQWSAADERAVTSALRATELTDLADRPVDELSSGERRRVALARALLRLRHGAWLLLADEPTAHLDHTTAARVTSAIEAAAEAGAAVLLATHTGLTHEPPGPDTATPVRSTSPIQHATRVRLRELVDGRLLAGAVLGALALGSAVALTATAAWLITRAAGHPSIVALSVAVIAVRAFGLGKGALRYA